jgi:hypothetical protein
LPDQFSSRHYREKMIVSVHLPKTAGSSLRVVLERHFGSRLLLDYADLPINTPAAIRNRKALQDAASLNNRNYGAYGCIHGHFLPAKYLPLKESIGALFVTWLRDPLERMCSHYNFWKRTYDPYSAPALHRRVVEESWSLEQFCFAAELKNFYAQFTWGFRAEFFDFIGITEHIDEDMTVFARRFLGTELKEVPTANVAPSDNSTEFLGANFHRQFRDFHEEDYRIYQAALTIRGYGL